MGWYPKKKELMSISEQRDRKIDVKTDEDLFLLEELLQDEMYEKSTKSLFHFWKNFWNCHDPAILESSWYHECLAEHIQAALQRQIRRLIINIVPRSGKSTLSSITTPPWWFINNPYEKFWLISHSARLFTQNIILSRRIIEHPLYANRWCNPTENPDYYSFSLAKDQNQKTRMETDAGGYILGGSPSSGALGMGYTVAILDDILDSEESQSSTAIESVNNWYTQTFLNRSNDNNNDVVIIVMQRLAENDLTGYVMKKYGEQDWFLLNLPAKYEPERTFISPIGFNDKRGVRNQLLDPVRFPEEYLITQSKNPIIFNTRYQQNPEAEGEGNFVKKEYLQFTDVRPSKFSVQLTVWDLSFTDNPESTYSVGSVFGLASDNKIYMIDMWRKQAHITEQVEAIRHMRKKYKDSLVAIERRSNGHAALHMLEREIPGLIPLNPQEYGGKKEQRLGAVLNTMKNGRFVIYDPFLPDSKLESTYSIADIKRELLGFPIASSDDIVDTISYGLLYLVDWGQENTAIVTGGEKIKLSEQDYYKENRSYNYEESSNGIILPFGDIPTRDYMMNLWN